VDTDSDSLLHRLQKLSVTKYRYTDEWRASRSLQDTEVRGMIAQDVAQHFPEYVDIGDEQSDLGLEQFHAIKKQDLAVDLIAALQARHQHFQVAANSAAASGSVSVMSGGSAADRNTGAVCMQSGAGGAVTGGALVSSGSACANAGGVVVAAARGELNQGGTLTLGALRFHQRRPKRCRLEWQHSNCNFWEHRWRQWANVGRDWCHDDGRQWLDACSVR
jgi:hypothetical protein